MISEIFERIPTFFWRAQNNLARYVEQEVMGIVALMCRELKYADLVGSEDNSSALHASARHLDFAEPTELWRSWFPGRRAEAS
jgi:hypothetical protein